MATGAPERSRSVYKSSTLCEGISCPAASDVPLWLCIPCSSTYCDICWDRQGPHKPRKIALDSRPHEKTRRGVYDRLQTVFNPPATNESLEDRAATLWLGIRASQQVDQPVHESCFETRRFSELNAQTSDLYASKCALVSFLGHAGSGMSTIVRLLLASTGEGLSRGLPLQESAEYDNLSGVHLYAGPEEPGSFHTLYADCKGLVDPDAAIETATTNSAAQSPRLSRRRFSSIFGSLPPESSHPKVEIPLSLPQGIMSNNYSHLMYTVSNVVVLVIRHSRALEIKTLIWLLELASQSLDFSFEQILLPQAIIVLSGSPQDTGEWGSVEKNSTSFLSDLNAHWNDSRLAKHLSQVKKQSRPISNVADLLSCHYSLIRTVRLPSKDKVMLFQGQASVLQHEIQKACVASYKYENSIRELKNAAELHQLVKEAFNHFTTRPGKPFTRVPLQFRIDPVTPDFKHHIVALAEIVSGRYASGVYLTEFEIFLAIAPVVASCIFTHCIRYDRPGSPANIYSKMFAPSCASALQIAIREHAACQYRYQEVGATLKCIIRKADHVKGHRMSNDSTRQGTFVPPSSFDSPTWLNAIMQCLVTIEDHLRTITKSSSICTNRTPNFVTEVYDLHRKKLGRFFQGFVTNVVSRFSCFGCLMEIPQFPLACGHFLCLDCVKMFGRVAEPGVVHLDICPLDANPASAFVPCSIRVGTGTTSIMPLKREIVQPMSSGGAGSS